MYSLRYWYLRECYGSKRLCNVRYMCCGLLCSRLHGDGLCR